MSLINAVLTPEGAAVIFGFSCLLFGILLVLDSKRKPGETQDYRFMQRVYGWLLIGVPTLFLLGGAYMNFYGSKLESMENPFGSNVTSENPFKGGRAYTVFDWIVYKIGLRRRY
jgi:hypothetical protein